jgi:predicted transcriptional regulator
MLAKEVSRALDELAMVIAKLQFVMAELQRATKSELKRQRKQSPPEGAR